jgi:hypothetical protein
MSKRNCTHWWKVPAQHLGPDAPATCKRCGATRVFPRTLPSQTWCLRRKSWRGQVQDMQDRLHEAENVQ